MTDNLSKRSATRALATGASIVTLAHRDTNAHPGKATHPTVFLVDDDEDIVRLIRILLENAGFLVRTFSHGNKALAQALREPPLLFLLDVMLPEMDGMELCRLIKSSPLLSGIPIIFVTARSSEADCIRGLEAGADDYIPKPFSSRELLARIKAVLRNSEPVQIPGILTIGPIEINPTAMLVSVAGKQKSLTFTEFRLLEFFARHLGRVFSRNQLLQVLWRPSAQISPRAIDVYVRRLREKIEEDPENPTYLKTYRGAGYRFDAGN